MDAAGPRVLVIQHEDVVPLRLLGGWLADAGAAVTVVRPDRDEQVPDRAGLAAYDALVVLGGTMDSWDDAGHPWFPAVRALLRDAGQAHVPTLAVCLGHQLAAQAYGGTVARNPAGRTAGVVQVGWTADAYADPLLGSIAAAAEGADAGPAIAVHHNSDVVVALPDDARVLARAPDGSPQAVRFAPTVWGVQFHPEADATLVAQWESLAATSPHDSPVTAEVRRRETPLRRTWAPLPALLAHAADRVGAPMSPLRQESPRMALTRLGFTDTEATLAALERIGVELSSPLAPVLGTAADPDLAARRLADLADAVAASFAEVDGPTDSSTAEERDALADRCRREFLQAVAHDEGTAMRLSAVLGASDALGEHLLRHPSHWRELTDATLGCTRAAAWYVRACLLRAVGADPAHEQPIATLPDHESLDALRVEYRRLLLRLVARDLAHQVGVDDIAAEISDLAAGTLEAALAVARARVAEGAHACRLAVIAMGKCGGHELNYVSDVDVVFVAEPAEGQPDQVAMRAATQLASHLIRICGDHTAEGTIWPVDANLRPEGKQGPLVRSLASYLGYYEKWARTWEFQALLKARPVAGDRDLGQAYVEAVQPMVWEASRRPNFVSDTQAMRRRVVEHIPAKERDRQIKLGPGGLRDVEFAVQLLQMVHGAADDSIRQPTTLSALDALTRGGYVGRDDGAALHVAYAFLRSVEHRLQLVRLRRTALIPTEADELRRLARSLGMRRKPLEQLEEALRDQRREVRRLHEKLFYRPLLESLAASGHEAALLSSDVASDRLAALGFADPAAALRHLDALTSGVSRSAKVRRALLPAMLAWLSDTPDPDAGLLSFRVLSEELGRTPWYLRMLRDEGEVAERLARVLGSSRYAASLLRREPEGVRLLAGESLRPLGRETLQIEMLATGRRARDTTSAIGGIRAIRRRDLVRVAGAELVGLIDVEQTATAISDLTHATLEATLAVAVRAVEEQRDAPLPTRMAVVSMGRLGGHEVSYGSDADVMFVHDPLPDADPTKASKAATAVANEMRRLLASAGPDPALELDTALRPEGNQGPLVRTLDSYAAYYARWSAVWEAQALLRADAVVGDADLCRRFTETIDPLRWPDAGLSEADVREVRRIKARVDDERLPRGADPKMHLKLGRGALTDIEWTVQLLQMQHAATVPGLRTTRTLDALRAACEEGLVTPEQTRHLERSWLWCSRARNAVVLVRGTPDDQVPREVRDLAAVSEVLGYEPGESEDMLNDLRRALRQARVVVDEIFWP